MFLSERSQLRVGPFFRFSLKNSNASFVFIDHFVFKGLIESPAFQSSEVVQQLFEIQIELRIGWNLFAPKDGGQFFFGARVIVCQMLRKGSDFFCFCIRDRNVAELRLHPA